MSTFQILSLALPILAFVALALLVGYLSRQSGRVKKTQETARPCEYDSTYYQPMRRLLDPDELAAARELDGVSELEFAQFRKARIQAFRGFLSDLRIDFSRLEFKASYLLLSGLASDSHLVSELHRTKLNFQSRVLRVEFELALFALGMGSVNVSGLLELLDNLDSVLAPSRSQTIVA